MSWFFTILLIVLAVAWALRSGTNKTQNKSAAHRKNGYAKWVGGGLGWAFGGPIGGILGFAFGKIFEDMNSGKFASDGTTGRGDFNASLLVLTAAVMKADGTVKRSELDYVKKFYITNFGVDRAEQSILMLREILKQDINLQDVSQQIGRFMDYPARLQLMHYLFGIGISDGQLPPSELDVITRIASFMGIQPGDFASIKAMFVKDTDSAYKILEIESSATDEEVKKAYRDMALKFHPDKVSHLGEEVQKAAEQKFKEVSNAYDEIKKARGIK
jgi:DnaJ like chaperone protein